MAITAALLEGRIQNEDEVLVQGYVEQLRVCRIPISNGQLADIA